MIAAMDTCQIGEKVREVVKVREVKRAHEIVVPANMHQVKEVVQADENVMQVKQSGQIVAKDIAREAMGVEKMFIVEASFGIEGFKDL